MRVSGLIIWRKLKNTRISLADIFVVIVGSKLFFFTDKFVFVIMSNTVFWFFSFQRVFSYFLQLAVHSGYSFFPWWIQKNKFLLFLVFYGLLKCPHLDFFRREGRQGVVHSFLRSGATRGWEKCLPRIKIFVFKCRLVQVWFIFCVFEVKVSFPRLRQK